MLSFDHFRGSGQHRCLPWHAKILLPLIGLDKQEETVGTKGWRRNRGYEFCPKLFGLGVLFLLSFVKWRKKI